MSARPNGVIFLSTLLSLHLQVNWSEERYRSILATLADFFKQIGFKDQSITYVPCSGFTGDNLITKSDTKSSSWFTGGTLIEYIGKDVGCSAQSPYELNPSLL